MKESHSIYSHKCQKKYIQFEPYNLHEWLVKFYVKYMKRNIYLLNLKTILPICFYINDIQFYFIFHLHGTLFQFQPLLVLPNIYIIIQTNDDNKIIRKYKNEINKRKN